MARNKYHNIKCEFNGIPFDSQAERDYYIYLFASEQSGDICDLVCQPKFELQPSFKDSSGKKERAITYTADFQYTLLANGNDVSAVIVVDVKSKATITTAYQIKKKLFKFKYPKYVFQEIVT